MIHSSLPQYVYLSIVVLFKPAFLVIEWPLTLDSRFDPFVDKW
jgi:hypothetical protein